MFCHTYCRSYQTAHRGPSAKQTESQSDASNAASAPANTSGPSGLKSKSSGKPDNSDGEDWGREQEEEEEEEEDDDDDDADEDYEAPGAHTPATGGSTQPPAQTEWTCPQCQTTFTDNDDYLGHVKMEHGKVWHHYLYHLNVILLNTVIRVGALFKLLLMFCGWKIPSDRGKRTPHTRKAAVVNFLFALQHI